MRTCSRSRLLAAPHRRAEAWLWTGPVGHLFGGSVDLLVALTRYQLARARGRSLR